MSAIDAAGNLDPTGVLSATTAAVRLVGTVLNVAPAVKRTMDARKGSTGQGPPGNFSGVAGENDVTGASTTAPPPATAAQIQSLALQRVDPERETRAYETVNYVLRTIGSRILEAKMVNMDALAKALTAATAHIEVKLFSGETNRLFQSLARKLNDVNLVNSVFTSIYLVGFLTAEIASSLPNYKKEYPALGPCLIQQMMRVAIGEDAFRENLTANLNAYQTVATTAGLLRPTDIGYSIFPDFPSFSPTRYSTKSIIDRQSHKNVLEKLVKHFDQFGFPQPLQGRDVGPIRDWRFLSGDSNSRAYEVDKADKQIGTNFGRVLYWLICSAHRMPSGMAVVGYLDQHIALIRYLGPRFGYRVLNTGGDLNVSGPHLQMNKKLRATFDTWVVIMPSETLIAERRAAAQSTTQTPVVPVAVPVQPQAAHVTTNSPPPVQPQTAPVATNSPPPQYTNTILPQSNPVVPVTVPVAAPQTEPISPRTSVSGIGHPSISGETAQDIQQGTKTDAQSSSTQGQASNISTALQQLNEFESIYLSTFLPPCKQFTASPPSDIDALKKEYFRLTESLQASVLFKIDAVETGTEEIPRLKRKALVDEVQGTMAKLDAIYREASRVSSPPSRPASMASLPSLRPVITGDPSMSVTEASPAELAAESVLGDAQHGASTPSNGSTTGVEVPNKIDTAWSSQAASVTSPISVSPSTTGTPSTPITAPLSISGLQHRPSVVRRKAPPPPKKVILAKALYDFEGEEEGGEELTFSEGDIIEIVEKNKALEEDGWCRARVKGQKKLGLAPLDYLEELPNQPSHPQRPSRMSSMTASEPILEQVEQQDAGPLPSKIDAKIDINVSSTSQSTYSIPNLTSPATQSMSLPNINSSPQSQANQGSANAPVSVPNQPPPSYTAATSPTISPGASPNPQAPYSRPPTGQTPGKPHRPNGPQHPQQGPGGPPIQYQNGPMGGPGMQYGPGAPQGPFQGQGLAAFVGLAGATAGFAQAGAQIFSAVHGNPNNQASNQQAQPQQPQSQQQSTDPANASTTNVYNETANTNQANNDASTNITNQDTTSNALDASGTQPAYAPAQPADSNYIAPNSEPTASSGPTADPSMYASTPAVDSSQYTSVSDTTGGGAVSPLAGLAPPVASDQSTITYDSGISGGSAAPVSPFASLATPPASDPNQYTDPASGAMSPFASLATPPDGSAATGFGDPSQSVSPFASMATADPTAAADSGAVTSPFASMATTDQGYFGDTATDTTGMASADAVSPFAGLANTSTIETTTVVSTTTDYQSSMGGGCGVGYADPSSMNYSTTTTTEVDTWTNTGGGWGATDYTATESASYDFGGGGSFEF